jgi:urease accessory protein
MRILALMVACLMAGAGQAAAHPSITRTFSFAAGLSHPLSGLDHLLAMMAVGFWAALSGGRRVWTWPLAFIASMLIGGGLAHEGLTLPNIEPAIAASAIILGLAIALLLKLPAAAGAFMIAAFGMAHGYAHGLEAPGAGFALYAAGFTLATAALHLTGIAGGFLIGRQAKPWVPRAVGALTAAAGFALLMQQ